MNRKVWAIKGVSGFNKPIFPRRAGGRHGSKNVLFLAGVDSAKEKVYSRLRVEKAGAGYCHFPLSRDREYFTQLCSERIATKHVNGFPMRCWVKSPAQRNEALDCRTYALVALHGLYQAGFSLEQHTQLFERMHSPSAERPESNNYEVIKSKWMS